MSANPLPFCIQEGTQTDKFIMTRAPMTKTAADFWQMIWEVRSHVIVMLTELTEEDQVRVVGRGCGWSCDLMSVGELLAQFYG